MSWAALEFQSIDLGDERLNRRAVSIADTLGLSPARTIPQAFQSWASTKACYNFFNNDLVSEKKIIAPHIEETIKRISHEPVILLISDTSELDYNSKEAMEGKERITNTKTGIWLHPTIAVTPERLMLGTVDVNFWNRNPEVNSAPRDNLSIEKKESYRWLKSYLQSCKIAQKLPKTKVINVMDREGDIIELFEEVIRQKENVTAADIIVRAQYDRLLFQEGNEEKEKLKQKLNEAPSLGEIEFVIPSTEKRAGRKVKQQIKGLTVSLKPSNKKIVAKMNVIMAVEEHPPEGEEALVWILITSLAVDTFDQAIKVINYYLCRWEIEIFFKILKSGCKIEERQLQATDRMRALITIFIVLAWRVQFTMMMGRLNGELPCEALFGKAEWMSVYKILHKKEAIPPKAPSLGEFIIMIAMLGGYINRKNEGPPGVKVMWKGMARMFDFALAWEAFGG